ncbi:hypothetical protein ANTPLA_LOCUS5260 [Anthophora plagiata]
MCRFLCIVLLFIVLPFTFQEALEERSCMGEYKCQQLCIAVAESAREKGPQMICEKLNTHVENLQVAVYAKVCNMTSWKFTGLKGLDPICCHEGKSVCCEQPTSTISI